MFRNIWKKGEKNPHSGQILRGCTSTEKSCTDTGSVMFFYFDQCSYFCHNLVISYPILVIQVSSKNRLQGELKLLKVPSNSDSMWPKNSLKVGLCSSQFLVLFFNIE